MALETLERLAEQANLVAPIEYNEKDKNSFFNAIRGWGNALGVEVTELNLSVIQAWKLTYSEIRKVLQIPADAFEDVGMSREYRNHLIKANIQELFLIPLTGSWGYDPINYQIRRGNKVQRLYVTLCQSDPLVHEYLHVYQHLLYKKLYQEGLVYRKHPKPSRIIEPPSPRCILRSPSYEAVKMFEGDILLKLIDFQLTE